MAQENTFKDKLLRFGLSPIGTVIILTVAILVVYGQSFWFGFIWDDNDFIVKNSSLKTWRQIPLWFYDAECYKCYNSFWRPVRNFSFLADWYICGKQQLAGWMHVHNVLMHIGCALMLLWVLRQLTRLFYPTVCNKYEWRIASLTAALLWAVHPLTTETVCWIKCRDDQVFLMLYLWGVGLFITGLLRHKPFTNARVFAIAALGFLSVLTKEMAISFPLILGLLWFLMPQTESGNKKEKYICLPSRSMCGLLILNSILMVLYVALRHAILGKTEQLERMSGSFYSDMLTFVRAIARYIELSVVPARQLADYSGYPCTTTIFNLDFLAALLLCVVCTGLSLWVGRKHKIILFAWGAFLISLLPVSNIVPTMQYLAERFMYLPLALLSIIFMVIFTKLCFYLTTADFSRKITFTTLTVLALLSVMLAANLRASIWKNTLLLFRTTWRDGYPSERILLNGMNSLMYYGLYEETLEAGHSLLQKQDHFVTVKEDLGLLHQVLGRCNLYLNHYDQALSHSLTALQVNPELSEAKMTLGVLRGIDNRTTEALELFDAVLAKKPKHTSAMSNKALALKKLGNKEEAKKIWNQVLEIDPEYEAALSGLRTLDNDTSDTEKMSLTP